VSDTNFINNTKTFSCENETWFISLFTINAKWRQV